MDSKKREEISFYASLSILLIFKYFSIEK